MGIRLLVFSTKGSIVRGDDLSRSTKILGTRVDKVGTFLLEVGYFTLLELLSTESVLAFTPFICHSEFFCEGGYYLLNTFTHS